MRKRLSERRLITAPHGRTSLQPCISSLSSTSFIVKIFYPFKAIYSMVKSRRDQNPNAVDDVNFEVDRIFKRFNIVSFVACLRIFAC